MPWQPSGSRKILRQRRWRYILNDSTLFYCAQGPLASRSMRRKGLNDSWQRCQRLLLCCDFNSDWRIRSGRHGLKSQSNTTLKRPIESVQQEQETEQVLLCCQGPRRKAKYRTSARGMRHMKSAGTVTRQDTSLETVGHPRMMQITRSSSDLSQGFEGPSQRAISEKMQAQTRVMR